MDRSRFLLLGRPTGHSVTPGIWNAVFEAAGRPWQFETRDVLEEELDGLFEEIREGRVPGAFVTMPYKAHAARAAQRKDDHVRRSGVANLVLPDRGGLAASNTDAAAVQWITDGRRFAHGLLLGSGGAARGALSGLVGRCDRLTIASLDAPGAHDLARRVEREFGNVDLADWERRASIAHDADLVVNATPLGMIGLDGEVPLPPEALGPRTWVYDFVYRPDGSLTPLQSVAASVGAPVSDGAAHVEAQAILALPVLGLDGSLSVLVSERTEAAFSRPPLRWAARP
jgi:shikimate dehydrogenase